ncbi:hypothetical protein BC629DRAFT_122193 [Irpex lacteus]|nr:hypothetical protein BC629DRAFT_122193 [Irpex lacteus]
MTSITQRFLDAEAVFLDALTSGELALAQFDIEWQALYADFEHAMTQSLLSASDVQVVYAVTSRIAINSDAFLKLERISTDLTSSFLSQVDHALSNLTLEDVAPTTLPRRHTTPYFAEAYAWILDNVYDPYPPSSLKRIWARGANVTTRVMDDWFKSLRKEIGWVALTKMHFNGSRSMAVQAASTVLLNDVDDASVPFEVQTELLAIKARLESLYAEERGLVAGPSTNKRPRSSSVSSSATNTTATSRSFSPSVQSDSSPDDTSTASGSPSSRATSRLPSLVFDQSDSEEDEQFPEFSTPHLLDDAALRVKEFAKDDDTSERQLKRSRHSYYDFSVEDSPSSWPIDPFSQLIDTHSILPNDLAAHPDFWSFPIEENSSSEMSPTALIDAIPTVDNVSASPTAALTSRKRRHEDAEPEAPASKKSRVIRNLPQSNPRKQQKASGATPVFVANTPPAPVEEPIVINWEQLLKDLEDATSKTGDGSFDVSGPIDCGVFDFAALDPSASTSKPNVDDLWNELLSADVSRSDAVPTVEELFASLTNVDALAEPDFPASADVPTVSIELPSALPSDLGLGTELTFEFPTYELYSSTTSPLAQAGEPEVPSLCNGFDNTTQLTIPDSTEESPSILDVLSCLDSRGSFDTYSSPLVAFS